MTQIDRKHSTQCVCVCVCVCVCAFHLSLHLCVYLSLTLSHQFSNWPAQTHRQAGRHTHAIIRQTVADRHVNAHSKKCKRSIFFFQFSVHIPYSLHTYTQTQNYRRVHTNQLFLSHSNFVIIHPHNPYKSDMLVYEVPC